MMIAQPEHATGSPWYGMGIVVEVIIDRVLFFKN